MKLASIATALLSLAATATAAVVPVPEADTAAAFESLDTANATDIAVSLLRPRAKCTLHIRWVSNWSEDAYRRYRVKAWADRGDAYGSSKEMVVEWSNRAGLEESVLAHTNNPQRWYEGDVAYVDVNFFEGSLGHNQYLDYHQRVANAWRWWSKECDVDSSF